MHLQIAAGALVLLTTVLLWPFAALIRRRGGRPRPAPPLVRLIAGLTALTCIGFAALLVSLVIRFDLLEVLILTGSPLLQIPLAVAAVLTAGVLGAAVAAWSRRWWGLAGRLHYSAVAVAAVVFIGLGLQYNLVWLP